LLWVAADDVFLPSWHLATVIDPIAFSSQQELTKPSSAQQAASLQAIKKVTRPFHFVEQARVG
jgi:hypothetical protein